MTILQAQSLSAQGYRNVALLFRTADDLLDFIGGPRQHDAHVEAYRGELWLAGREAAHARANAAVAYLVDQLIAERRARR